MNFIQTETKRGKTSPVNLDTVTNIDYNPERRSAVIVFSLTDGHAIRWNFHGDADAAKKAYEKVLKKMKISKI